MLWCLNIFYFIFIVVLAIVDQKSKKYAVIKLNEAHYLPIRVGVFRFIIVRNPGAAFGILSKKRLILKIITLALILLLLIYTIRAIALGESVGEIVSLAFLTGGALGNFIDRVRQNYVIDFISFNINRCPVFNMADLFIFTGCILFALFY